MTVAVARRWLKVADPTALTARETLRSALGFGDRVAGVARSEILAFAWLRAVDARGVLEGLARETNLLQNPNKHFLEIAVGEERVKPRGGIWVLTAQPGDGVSMGEGLLRRHLVTGTAPATARGILWELDLAGSGDARRSLAESIAVARGRTAGLLANPHVEDVRIFTEIPTARSLAESLGLTPRTLSA